MLHYKRQEPSHKYLTYNIEAHFQTAAPLTPSVPALFDPSFRHGLAAAAASAVISLFRRANYQCRTHVWRTGYLIRVLAGW